MSLQRRDLLTRVPVGAAMIGMLLPQSAVASAAVLSAAHPPSVFQAALLAGDFPQAERLLAQEPALLYSRGEGDVSMYRAALEAGRRDAATWLTEKGYRRDVFDMAAEGDTKSFSAMFDADQAVLHQRDRFGQTLVHAAVRCQAVPMVELLISRGAPADGVAADPPQPTPLAVALARGPAGPALTDILEIMLGNNADANRVQPDGSRPLHHAARLGDPALVRLLLRKGADPAATDGQGRTPAAIAKEAGHREIAKLLGSPTSVARDSVATRLRARSGEEVGNLTADGLPISLINQFVVFSHFNIEKVKEWLTRCPDLINRRAQWDELAVEGAAHVGFRPGLDLLLEKGAPLSLATATTLGDLALMRSLIQEHPDSLRLRGPHDIPLAFYPAFGKGDVAVAELLKSAGVDMTTTLRGASILHHCAQRGHVDLARWAIEEGCDPNSVARASFLPGTPVEIARRRKNDAMVALLEQTAGKSGR